MSNYFQQFICHPQENTGTIQSKFLCLPDQVVLAGRQRKNEINYLAAYIGNF